MVWFCINSGFNFYWWCDRKRGLSKIFLNVYIMFLHWYLCKTFYPFTRRAEYTLLICICVSSAVTEKLWALYFFNKDLSTLHEIYYSSFSHLTAQLSLESFPPSAHKHSLFSFQQGSPDSYISWKEQNNYKHVAINCTI